MRRSPSRILGAVAVLYAASGAAAAHESQAVVPIVDGAEIMRVAEITPGMTGTGYTVVHGSEPEAFQVEILGILHDVFPKHDLIVARLSGLDLERSGVMAGMSGSPVVIDGRVIGAVAYRLVNFGYEAIAGIIPIESMLSVLAMEDVRGRQVAAGPGNATEILQAAAAYLTGTVPTTKLRPVGGAGIDGLRPIATPMTFAGFHPEIIGKLRPLFEDLGWAPMLGGTAATGSAVTANLVPGGAVAVQLIRGDINVTASGTVTYRDGDRILAFGHPFLQGGAVDFPMVAAQVITVLKSANASSKLSVAGTEVLGSFRQDRLAAIMGVVGARPTLVPVRVRLEAADGSSEELEFELISDKILTPLYLFLGLVNGVQSLDSAYGEGSIQLGAEFYLGGGLSPVRFDNLFASANQAIIGLSTTLASIFGFLYDNSFEPIEVREVAVKIRLRDDRKMARISRVWYDRAEVHPGDTVHVSVALQPYREAEVIERLAVRIPPGLAPGPLTLLIGDANAVSQEEASFIHGTIRPRDLEHLVRLLNSIRRSDRIYMQASRQGEGALLGGEVLPALPPSMMRILSSEQSSGDFVRLKRTVIFEEAKAVDYVVSGSHKIELDVRNR